MPKTGTTFLQNSMLLSKAELLNENILYLSTNAALGVKPPPQHRYIAHAIMNVRRRITPKADFALLDAHVNALKEEMAKHPQAIPVMSTEAFYAFKEQHIAMLRALFPGEGVKILVYLRRQDVWVDSWFAQSAKRSRPVTPEGIYDEHKWHLDYDRYLRLWGTYFGEANLIVRRYEGTAGKSFNVWDDFFEAIGGAGGARVSPPPSRSNPALSRELTLFMRAQHVYGHQLTVRKMFCELDKYFPKGGKGVKYIGKDLARRIIAEAQESNIAVAKRYFNRDILFEDSTITGASRAAELSPDDVAQVVGGVSMRLAEEMQKINERAQTLEKIVDELRLRAEAFENKAGEIKLNGGWTLKNVMARLSRRESRAVAVRKKK